MLRLLAPTKNKLLSLLGVVLVSGSTFYVLLNTARQEALNTFNKHMAKQSGFNGSVTVDALYPDFKGNVVFHNLQFINNGDKILVIPYGQVKLKLWDIATRTLSIDSIEELELNDVSLCLRFSKKMHMDLAAHNTDDDTEGAYSHKPTKQKYLNIKDRLPNVKITLRNADISVEHNKKTYHMEDAFCTLQVKEHHLLDLRFSCNDFRGSIIGTSCDFSGTVDLSNQQHKAHLNLALYDVVPRSLGLGKLSNPLTILGEVKGDLVNPSIDGAITMKRLDIPPMIFRNVKGNYHYYNDVAAFQDVTAEYAGGPVEAEGVYNFTKRSYTIHAVGHHIELSTAIKHGKLKGPANVNLHMYAVPDRDKTLIFGDFAAGPGRFAFIPFKSMTGVINNQSRRLDITDIAITTEIGSLYSDHLTLKDKRASFGPMYIDYGDGNRKLLYQRNELAPEATASKKKQSPPKQ